MQLYLVNYRHRDSEPFKSITDLPLEEAKKLAELLHGSSACKAHRRFGADFVQYYENRKKAEQWLYEKFRKQGGKPNVKHPLYFTLQSSEEMSGNYGEYLEIRLNLDEIDDCDISFTFGDSMALYYMEKLHKMFTKKDVLKQLELFDNDVNKMLEQTDKQAVFIEAQLWNDKYLKVIE